MKYRCRCTRDGVGSESSSWSWSRDSRAAWTGPEAGAATTVPVPTKEVDSGRRGAVEAEPPAIAAPHGVDSGGLGAVEAELPTAATQRVDSARWRSSRSRLPTHRETMKSLAAIFPEFGKARLENISRTETMAAYNQGRVAMFRDGGVAAVQFAAILDDRTTAICRSRDGLVMELEDPRLAGNTPPLHFMCRSVLVPITRSAWKGLQRGDARLVQRHFGWLGPERPRNLEEALSRWDDAPDPLPGFGGVRPPAASSQKRSEQVDEAAKGNFSPVWRKGTKEARKIAQELIDEGRIHLPRSVWDNTEPGLRREFSDRFSRAAERLTVQLSRLPAPLLREIEKASDDGLRLELVHRTRTGRIGLYDKRTRRVEFTLEAIDRDIGAIEEEMVHALDTGLDSGWKVCLRASRLEDRFSLKPMRCLTSIDASERSGQVCRSEAIRVSRYGYPVLPSDLLISGILR